MQLSRQSRGLLLQPDGGRSEDEHKHTWPVCWRWSVYQLHTKHCRSELWNLCWWLLQTTQGKEPLFICICVWPSTPPCHSFSACFIASELHCVRCWPVVVCVWSRFNNKDKLMFKRKSVVIEPKISLRVIVVVPIVLYVMLCRRRCCDCITHCLI